MNRLFGYFSSAGKAGLAANVLTVWTALAISLLLLSLQGSTFGPNAPQAPRGAPWTPPGAFIGAVWSILYTCMGASLWAVNRAPDPARNRLKISIIALIGFCLVWPFYAFGTSSRWPGLLGNLGILLLVLFAVSRLWSRCPVAAALLAPIGVWITIATATILDGAARYGW